MTWLKRLLMVLGALWLISIFAGAVILWGNDWRFGAGCLVAGVALIGSAIIRARPTRPEVNELKD
ncbi:hypothetical protein [Bradyrhizobium diazoefficiens]|nr:hypothetical protein XF16B_46830 [Bradyrhizobium diazoefficiens]BCF70336.1 hypothetical protein XF19B_46890 [Bradyrhizobium diazoefficiens]